VLELIQNDLIQDPARWPIIRGTNGARKGRVADSRSGRGKSGGFRYLYVYFPDRGRIHLLFMFAKHDQANLSAAQKKVIARMIDAVIKER
jgi:putative transcriptional regulator